MRSRGASDPPPSARHTPWTGSGSDRDGREQEERDRAWAWIVHGRACAAVRDRGIEAVARRQRRTIVALVTAFVAVVGRIAAVAVALRERPRVVRLVRRRIAAGVGDIVVTVVDRPCRVSLAVRWSRRPRRREPRNPSEREVLQ